MNLIASFYRMFDIFSLFSGDADEHLQGLNELCGGNTNFSWYNGTAIFLFLTTVLIYLSLYHIFASPERSKLKHWWMYAGFLFLVNFVFGFFVLFNVINSDNYCVDLTLTVKDAIGFGISNALWSFILFSTLSSSPYPRRWSDQCRNTTFWKPKS